MPDTINMQRNEALGRQVAEELNIIEAQFPGPSRSRYEAAGTLDALYDETKAAFRAKPGVDTHRQLVKALRRQSAFCMRAIKDLSCNLPAPGSD